VANLYEYQGKEILKSMGVAVPEGGLASSPEQARQMAERIARPVVIKAQVWVTGRAAAGGVKFADRPSETQKIVEEMLARDVKHVKAKGMGAISFEGEMIDRMSFLQAKDLLGKKESILVREERHRGASEGNVLEVFRS
jgi:succinyl-CoA synthetase beta subunit